MKATIVTTRFNSNTWIENYEYRNKYNIPCIYTISQRSSPKLEHNSLMFVIEMNNSINRLEGVGLIRNNIQIDKYYKIYNDNNFNRYCYKGKYYIERTLLENYNKELIDILDRILFKGKAHLKRGSGFTTLTEKLLRNEICSHIDINYEIKNIFLQHFGKNMMNNNIEIFI